MVREENDNMQISRQALEAQYIDEQGKWSNMSKRVTQHLDEQKRVYQVKFPLDPFQRDQVFKEDAQHLIKDLHKQT